MVSWFPGWRIFHEPIWTSRLVGEVKIKKNSACPNFLLCGTSSPRVRVGRPKWKKKWVPISIFLLGVFSLHRSIRHPENQLTMALQLNEISVARWMMDVYIHFTVSQWQRKWPCSPKVTCPPTRFSLTWNIFIFYIFHVNIYQGVSNFRRTRFWLLVTIPLHCWAQTHGDT